MVIGEHHIRASVDHLLVRGVDDRVGVAAYVVVDRGRIGFDQHRPDPRSWAKCKRNAATGEANTATKVQ